MGDARFKKKKNFLMIAFFLIWGLWANTVTHDFHVSKGLVEYSVEDRALRVSLHLFRDDLEAALRLAGAGELWLCTPREAPQAEAQLTRYLRDHFRLRSGAEAINLILLGKELSDDGQAVWCYLQAGDLDRPGSLTVTNTLLMELFDDQRNILTLIGPAQGRNMLLFQKNQVTQTATFK